MKRHCEFCGCNQEFQELCGNSHVVLRGKSHVVLRDNSHAVLFDNSHAQCRSPYACGILKSSAAKCSGRHIGDKPISPKVLNKRTDKIPSDAVYVGRPSKWGNPFKMNDPLLPAGLSRLGRRKAVIAEYHLWITRQPGLMDSLRELKGKDLVCWCAPLPCHADVLLELVGATQ